jgi:hypothetical protein
MSGGSSFFAYGVGRSVDKFSVFFEAAVGGCRQALNLGCCWPCSGLAVEAREAS